MIKLLPNQIKTLKPCPLSQKQVACSQSINPNTKPKIKYGKILCLESDECKQTNCKYHNNYVGDEL